MSDSEPTLISVAGPGPSIAEAEDPNRPNRVMGFREINSLQGLVQAIAKTAGRVGVPGVLPLAAFLIALSNIGASGGIWRLVPGCLLSPASIVICRRRLARCIRAAERRGARC